MPNLLPFTLALLVAVLYVATNREPPISQKDAWCKYHCETQRALDGEVRTGVCHCLREMWTATVGPHVRSRPWYECEDHDESK